MNQESDRIKSLPASEKRRHSREWHRNLRLSVIAVIIAVVFLFPIYWMLQLSFKSDMETFGKVLTYFPHEFTIDPWMANLGDKDFIASLKNSFLNGLFTMVLTMLFGIPAAYGMGRYKVRGYQAFLLIFLVAQMLPASLMLTPMYLTFSKMHLLGTYAAPPLQSPRVRCRLRLSRSDHTSKAYRLRLMKQPESMAATHCRHFFL